MDNLTCLDNLTSQGHVLMAAVIESSLGIVLMWLIAEGRGERGEGRGERRRGGEGRGGEEERGEGRGERRRGERGEWERWERGEGRVGEMGSSNETHCSFNRSYQTPLATWTVQALYICTHAQYATYSTYSTYRPHHAVCTCTWSGYQRESVAHLTSFFCSFAQLSFSSFLVFSFLRSIADRG